jgi:arginase family enzyme
MGGTQEITLGCHEAVMKYRGHTRLLTVDARLDMDKGEEEISSDTWLKKILEEKEGKTRYINLGHQEYLVSHADLDRLSQKGFHSYRLGHVREDLSYYEPLFRDADIHSFDLAAVRQSDAPGTLNPSPNGFSGNEICQMALFSGLSDHVSVFLVSEVNPRLDMSGQTAHLAAQMIWFFSHGLAQRVQETPDPANEEFTQFIINLTGTDHKITFLKSTRTDRWWFLSPLPDKHTGKQEWVACSYRDYLMAGKQEIPERWLDLLK